MKLPYDHTSKESILEYGRLLLGKTLRDLHPDAVEYSTGKGRMGQSVEKFHFGYSPNSEAEADFAEAGVELKCTPMKVNADGSMVSKERLVLNIIDYVAEAQTTFYTSSFWHKNQLILLMFYLHENGVDVIDLIFKIVRLWNFPDVDRKIIRDDWNKLHWKMSHGLAHEISEGDTLYLGACPKGSKAGAEMRNQYVPGAPKAQQRAYSIKSKYLNTIILESLLHPEMCDGVYISDAQRRKIEKTVAEASNLVNSLDEYEEEETFEQLVERRFIPYYGKNVYEIERMTGWEISNNPKSISNKVIHAILGITTPKIKEFEKANLQQKSIRLEPSGVLKESMVFSQIDYKGIVEEEEWEDSVWYETLTQRFLFIVFRKSADGDNKKAVLEKVFFWTMPRNDLRIARDFWKDTKIKIAADDFNHFWKLGDHKICHVRPKARNNDDTMEAPSGRMVTKKGYWLNAEYILDIVNANLRDEVETEEKPSFLSQYEYNQLKDKSGFLPVYTIEGACGYFGSGQIAEIEGWYDASNLGFRVNAKTQYIVHAKGNSMLPKINDGDLCVFEYKEGTADEGEIVLMECSQFDIDYDGQYTIKKYTKGKHNSLWNKEIILLPLNTAEYSPIHLYDDEGVEYKVVGVLKKVIRN